MTDRYTPGPWRAVSRSTDEPEYDEFLGWEIEGPPDAYRGQFARKSDAVLAAAAPELLAACEAALDALNELMGADYDVSGEQALLKAAIARAKGATHDDIE